VGKNEKLPLLTPWHGAEKEEYSKAEKKILLLKSGSMELTLTPLLFHVEFRLNF